MGLILNTSLCRVRVNGICDGQAVLNVLDYHVYKSGGAAPGTTFAEMIFLFRAIWRTDILPLLSSTYNVLDYSVTEINGRTKTPPAVGPARFTYGAFAQLVGVISTDQGTASPTDYPTFVTASAIKRTANAGRKERGRIALSPIPESAVTENTVKSANITAFDAGLSFLTSFSGTGVGDVCQLVLFHQAEYLGTRDPFTLAPSDKPSDHMSDVQSIHTRLYAGSQVSRKRKRLSGQ